VLLPLRAERPDALDGAAPGLDRLGVMLPCTPIQFLLAHEAPDLLLVMTSANPGGEPIVVGNDEARQRLRGIADALLMHDRDIVARCDDSVVHVTARGAPQFVRRARGYTPLAVRLPRAGPAVLATGGWLKNTVCLTRGDEAFLSPHVGDLDDAATCRALVETALSRSLLNRDR
jgi:hydrogenase maturation protein HypF